MYKYKESKNRFVEKILDIAREKDIPVRDDPDMMKVLVKLDFGEEVPQEFYKIVTEILSFVYRVNKMACSEGVN